MTILVIALILLWWFFWGAVFGWCWRGIAGRASKAEVTMKWIDDGDDSFYVNGIRVEGISVQPAAVYDDDNDAAECDRCGRPETGQTCPCFSMSAYDDDDPTWTRLMQNPPSRRRW